MNEHFDVIVVGGGAVGGTLACRLSALGWRVALVEARVRQAHGGSFDARVLALSHASRLTLARSGVEFECIAATPIDEVHVSQAGTFGHTLFTAQDLQLPHLGYTVAYADLDRSLNGVLHQECARSSTLTLLEGWRATQVHSQPAYAVLNAENADGIPQQLTARVVIAADGGGLVQHLPDVAPIEYDYQQVAILARVALPVGASPYRAYERFATGGALALLPVADHMMLVWTRSRDEASHLLTLSEEGFLARFVEVAGQRFAGASLLSQPHAVPLKLRMARRVVTGRVVLVGNAAQTLHPVAAQGLNLGLRDVETLCRVLQGVSDAGSAAVLARYERERRIDRLAVTGFTHGLIQLFERDTFAPLRGLGMALLDSVGFARRRFAQHLVFGVSA